MYKNILLDVDFRSSISDIKSKSIYPYILNSSFSKIKNISLVFLKYLRIHFIEVQYSSLGFDRYLLVTLTAWVISGHIQSIAYMRLSMVEA